MGALIFFIFSIWFGSSWVDAEGLFNVTNPFANFPYYLNSLSYIFDLEFIKTNTYNFFSCEIPKRYNNFIDGIPNELPDPFEVLPKIFRIFSLFFIMLYLTMQSSVFALQLSNFIPLDLITLVLDQYELLARIPVIISDFINLSCDKIFGFRSI
jgi:hypothetical protein